MWMCGDSTHPPTLESLVESLQNPEIGEEEIATKVLKGSLVGRSIMSSVLYTWNQFFSIRCKQ